jgi:hypothetical protein
MLNSFLLYFLFFSLLPGTEVNYFFHMAYSSTTTTSQSGPGFHGSIQISTKLHCLIWLVFESRWRISIPVSKELLSQVSRKVAPYFQLETEASSSDMYSVHLRNYIWTTVVAPDNFALR